ncbi:methylmalonyl-CoA mutase family protein [Caulobacter sp. S45]|uniref:methylmalonyl-CoA mutase family protein n=1 Tax=Caulobacter sp. S45 TaxID=1641861 RepID=UPI00157704BF|nr:methylmalonyl-CoA mutase family protein [Caulobacter sp. S45]
MPLAADFPIPSHEAWVALVEKTLKGASPDTLTRSGYDGLPVEPLYTASPHQPDSVRFSVTRSQGEGRWDVRTVLDTADPARANADALQDLENGANSLLLRVDPTGRDGVAVASAEDMARVLTGVEIELAPVALDAGFLGVQAAQWLHAAAKSAPRAQLALHLDPLSAFARAGASPGPIEAHLAQAATLAAELRDTYPDATAFLASGAVTHEAGGAEAQELAVMLAAAAAYLRALNEAGVPLAEVPKLITLGLAADGEYFITLAKLRAARGLWSRLCAALGATAPARVEARSSRRMLSRLDPWVNLLRLTAAGFGAAVGGADAIVLEPFTQPLGHPTPFARRQARNAQLVLMEESGLARVADPAGGAWFLETQTDQLARAAWALFQQIEAAGGLAQALRSSLISGWVETARTAMIADLASGARQLIGVTVFRNPDEAPVAVETYDPADVAKPAPQIGLAGGDSACPPLSPWRAAEAFEGAPGAAA